MKGTWEGFGEVYGSEVVSVVRASKEDTRSRHSTTVSVDRGTDSYRLSCIPPPPFKRVVLTPLSLNGGEQMVYSKIVTGGTPSVPVDDTICLLPTFRGSGDPQLP